MTRSSSVRSRLRETVAAPLYHGVREQLAVARYARRNESVALPLGRRLWLWRHGFVSGADRLYDLDTYGPGAYLSARQHYRTGDINGHWSGLVENKLAGHWLLSRFDTVRQPIAGLLVDGRAVPADRLGPGSSTSTGAIPDGIDGRATADAATFVEQFLAEAGRVVLKPVFGGRGIGIVFATRTDDGVRVNGSDTSVETFRRRVADLDGYLVAGFVRQADYAAKLYPDATNTLRVLTMVDPDSRAAFVAAAIHRIGTDDSTPVDNTSRGGLSAWIDPETGQLSRATTTVPSRREWYTSHPDTGAQIEGVPVPGWDRLHERVTEIATDLPYLPYLGWDLVVTGPDRFQVLELNNLVGPESLQVHRPLLIDDRIRAFYEHHGVC